MISIVTNSKGSSPYTSVTPMSLEVKLENLEFYETNFHLILTAILETTNIDGSSEARNELIFPYTPSFSTYDIPRSITKSGNTYTETWKYDDEIYGKSEGSLIVTLNSEHSKVISYTLNRKETSFGDYQEYTVSCTNAEIPNPYSNAHLFSVEKTQTCGNIQTINFLHKYSWSDKIWTLKEIDCLSDLDSITITFIK